MNACFLVGPSLSVLGLMRLSRVWGGMEQSGSDDGWIRLAIGTYSGSVRARPLHPVPLQLLLSLLSMIGLGEVQLGRVPRGIR
ncbi:hypothetical protein LZ32DRAFT_597566 [Colletotrichum eremochloae]|nr:hypothetical protein LZ32DRAFT_597566 [Colletotrichum eremochloae]